MEFTLCRRLPKHCWIQSIAFQSIAIQSAAEHRAHGAEQLLLKSVGMQIEYWYCSTGIGLVIGILQTEKSWETRKRRNETGFRENTLFKVFWKKYFEFSKKVFSSVLTIQNKIL